MLGKFAVGHRQIAASVIILSITGMVAATYSIIAVPLAKEFHPTRMVLMLAMTVLSGASALLAPLLGSLMDRVSVRSMMTAGAAFLGAGFIALSFAQTFNQVLLAYGLLIAPANVLLGPLATTVLLSRWFVKHRGRAIGIAISGVAIGALVFSPVIQALLNVFEWRTAIRLLALILVACLAPAVAMVVDHPARRGLHADGADTDPQPVALSTDAPPLSVLAILSDPSFWLVALVAAVVTSGMKGMVTSLVPIALDEGVAPMKAAGLISVYAGCGLVSKLGFAMISDRFNPRHLMLASLAGFALGAAALVKAELGYPMIVLGVGMIGLFGGLMVPMQQYLMPRVFGPRIVGRAGGLLSSVVLLALLSTPPLFGQIFDSTGNYDLVFMLLAALGAASLLAVPAIRLHPREIAAPRTVPAE